MFARLFLLVPLILVAAAAAFWVTLPDVAPLAREFPKSTAFMDQKRRELSRRGLAADLEYRPVPLKLVSPFLARAVIAAEDAHFYDHAGVDWDAIRSAAQRDWAKKRLKLGGSTLTQQLAKNLYLSPARTPWRKVREWAIARRLERGLSKSRILELYVNVIELGPRTYGVEAAARRYFHKSASALTAREAATLAAMIPSPRIFDPVLHPERVRRRAARILRGM